MMTIVDVEGRKFQIQKMNAKTAVKTARILGGYVTQLAPLVNDIQTGDLSAFGQVLSGIKDEDIDKLIDFALPCVYEMKPAGAVQVVNPDTGSYNVQNLEDDPVLIMRLVYEAVREGVAGFFQGNRLASVFEGVTSLLPIAST